MGELINFVIFTLNFRHSTIEEAELFGKFVLIKGQDGLIAVKKVDGDQLL
jgi:hypothetical protein